MKRAVSAALFALTLLLAATCVLAQADAPAVPSFSFIQISDEHFIDEAGSVVTICELAALGEVKLQPCVVTAPAPSFVIETGDLTEFGARNGAWDAHNKAWSIVKLPRYMALGNHDETWQPLSAEMRRLYGAPYYSWDFNGCHFVVLDSPGLLDPRPVFGPEQLGWLKQDLAKVGPDKPVVIALHHPLETTEFSSSFETDRLVDMLRPYNVLVILVGHSHGVNHKVFEGIDMVRGGSAYGPCPPGYAVAAIVDGKLSIAYKERGKPEAKTALLEKPIAPPAKRYPTIAIELPQERASYGGEVLIKARINVPAEEIRSAWFEIDGAVKTNLTASADGAFQSRRSMKEAVPGAHYVRVSFEGHDGATYHRSASFYVDPEGSKLRWRAFMESASKTTLAVSDDAVYVGANDGYLRAYNRQTGKFLWQVRTGGPIAGEPLLLDGNVFFGSEDKGLYCVSAKGDVVWKFDAEAPIYASAITDGKSIFFGCSSGALYSIDAITKNLNWVNRDASYTIESKPFLADGKVFYGAWDRYVYCVNATDGKLAWKAMAQGSADGKAAIYYSAADCGPVASAGKVFIADRKFDLSIMDASSGKILKVLDSVAGVGLAEDGAHLYLRRLGGSLAKIDLEGNFAWRCDCSMDDVPTAPREVGGVVYVCSKRGLVSAVSAQSGKILWQYQATPSSYVFSAVGVRDKTAYVSGSDGSLTAIGE